VVAPPPPTYLGEPGQVSSALAAAAPAAEAKRTAGPKPFLVASGIEVEVAVVMRWRR
jgi:hypothetical protein